MKTALGPNISPSGLAAGSIIFPIDSNLLDHRYPVVLAYNGINHYVSTYILDQKSKNSAILNLMKTMTANISQVSEGLAGRGQPM